MSWEELKNLSQLSEASIERLGRNMANEMSDNVRIKNSWFFTDFKRFMQGWGYISNVPVPEAVQEMELLEFVLQPDEMTPKEKILEELRLKPPKFNESW